MTDSTQTNVDNQSTKTVLIVEDDPDIGPILQQAFKDETSYQAFLVSDGFAALKIITTISPHLFLIDHHLPGMDGLKLTEHLHATKDFEQVPIIMMSANLPQKEIKKRQLKSIAKPFDLNVLLQMVREILA